MAFKIHPRGERPDWATPAPDALPVGTDERAYAAIRRLLGGENADFLAGKPLVDFGRWTQTLRLLLAAHDEGGTEALTSVYTSLVRSDEGLALLMTSDPASRRKCWKMRELLTADFPPPEFVVPGLLPTGLSILAGRPKLGKSWLALQLAVAVDSGGELLGVRVPQGKVLYLALEDTEFRLSDRLKKQTLGPDGRCTLDVVRHGDADFHTEWSPFNEQGLSDLRNAFDKGYKLVIVDTLSRAAGRLDQMDPVEMTRLLAVLQRMAVDHKAALLLVDHHRKSARFALDTDPIDDILGSTAKGGVVDCALGLYRRHNEDEATLKLVGRDFSDRELALQWDAAHFRWQTKPEASGRQGAAAGRQGAAAHFTLREQEAIDAVAALGCASLGELTVRLGLNKSNLYHRLQNLCGRGALQCGQGPRGFVYSLPDDAQEQAVAAVAAVVNAAEMAAEMTTTTTTSAETEVVAVAEVAPVAEIAPVAEVAPIVNAAEIAEATTTTTNAEGLVAEVATVVTVVNAAEMAAAATTTTGGQAAAQPGKRKRRGGRSAGGGGGRSCGKIRAKRKRK